MARTGLLPTPLPPTSQEGQKVLCPLSGQNGKYWTNSTNDRAKWKEGAFKKLFIYFNWRIITLQYCDGLLCVREGFPGSSAGKESACKAGDPGSIPGSGRYPGEGIGYPLQYSWASLAAQMVNKPSAMQETWVQSLGWTDPPEKGKVTHSSILA